MSDEKIDHAALAGKLRRYAHSLEEVEEYEVEAWRDGMNLTTLELTEAADALEAAQQAPAVDPRVLLDRDTGSVLDHLVSMFNGDEAGDIDYVSALDGNTGYAMRGGNDLGAVVLKVVGAMQRAGILQDAAEVEARGLKKAAGLIRSNPLYEESVDGWTFDLVFERAQQVREGKLLD